uniref:Uncharacterized protein n=1 Tax=Anguilla anguilla TaxID=7936 RepID=A0A0E9UVZ4_ANGAN
MNEQTCILLCSVHSTQVQSLQVNLLIDHVLHAY